MEGSFYCCVSVYLPTVDIATKSRSLPNRVIIPKRSPRALDSRSIKNFFLGKNAQTALVLHTS